GRRCSSFRSCCSPPSSSRSSSRRTSSSSCVSPVDPDSGTDTVTFWVVQFLNGLSFGMLLFLLAAGLSLIFGLMRILNLAHGAYYLLGAYVALSGVEATGSLALGALAGLAAVIAVGVVMERVFLRRLPPHDELPQALMTFGFLLIVGDVALWIWG